jgi:beta-lactamase class A
LHIWRFTLCLPALVFVFWPPGAVAQTALVLEIRAIAAAAHGKVSVACSLPEPGLNCDLHPHAHPPMQSVFKFPLALAALHLVEEGRLSLDQPVRFLASDRIPHAYSPLQDKYPRADVDVPVRELLRLAVSLSDNVAADVVLRTIGGPSFLNTYIRSIGVSGFHVEDNEMVLHRDVAAQYRNWFEPAGAVELLRRVSDNSPLTPGDTELILEWMRDSPSAPHRIKGRLPRDAVVMHKSGTSDTGHGMTYATNDIGLVTLPTGRRLAIAVFITDSTADEDTRDTVIARIALAAYEESLRPLK